MKNPLVFQSTFEKTAIVPGWPDKSAFRKPKLIKFGEKLPILLAQSFGKFPHRI